MEENIWESEYKFPSCRGFWQESFCCISDLSFVGKRKHVTTPFILFLFLSPPSFILLLCCRKRRRGGLISCRPPWKWMSRGCFSPSKFKACSPYLWQLDADSTAQKGPPPSHSSTFYSLGSNSDSNFGLTHHKKFGKLTYSKK